MGFTYLNPLPLGYTKGVLEGVVGGDRASYMCKYVTYTYMQLVHGSLLLEYQYQNGCPLKSDPFIATSVLTCELIGELTSVAGVASQVSTPNSSPKICANFDTKNSKFLKEYKLYNSGVSQPIVTNKVPVCSPRKCLSTSAFRVLPRFRSRVQSVQM